MTRRVKLTSIAGVSLALGLGLSACAPSQGGGPSGVRQAPAAMAEAIQSLLTERKRLKAFDSNADAEITLAELENGLERLFAELDLDRDGALRAAEVSLASERLSVEDPAMPPLRDWNQSGAVEFDEFAAWTRGRFRRTDANQDGTITQAELTAPPRMPSRPPGGMPQGEKPLGGGMPGGRLSQSVSTTGFEDI